jgi:peptidoglycan/xylan/chitin deacetylase (PgdA/CDA1 family)
MRNPVTGLFGALIATAASMPAFSSARAEDCPGNPDALGTSRVLTIDPSEYPHVGAMDRAAALPLSDREVVITFDDGPVPRYSNQVPSRFVLEFDVAQSPA